MAVIWSGSKVNSGILLCPVTMPSAKASSSASGSYFLTTSRNGGALGSGDRLAPAGQDPPFQRVAFRESDLQRSSSILRNLHATEEPSFVSLLREDEVDCACGKLGEAGLIFSGTNPELDLVEMVELENHPHFIGCQFHPEFKSKPFAPHPLFSGFIRAALLQRDRK